MSIRENIQIFHQVNIEQYLDMLKNKYGVREHPNQPNSFLIGDPKLPFYKPEKIDDHISVLGFNCAPLPEHLIHALIDHPEIVPDEIIVRWTQEQGLVFESTMGDLRRETGNNEHRAK